MQAVLRMRVLRLLPSTTSSVISCAARDVFPSPSISVSAWQAGNKGLLEPVSSVSATEDHITSTSVRTPPGNREGVVEGRVPLLKTCGPSRLTFGAVVKEQPPKHEQRLG